MKPLLTATATALVLVAAPAQAAPYRQGNLEVDRTWSRPAAAGMNGAGFMTVTNRGKTADALVSVESPAARKTEIHRSSTAGGVMSMQRLERVAIPPGGTVTFAPGGAHVMLMGLNGPLKTGDRAPATLTFASGAKIKVEFAVGTGAAPSTAPDPHAHH